MKTTAFIVSALSFALPQTKLSKDNTMTTSANTISESPLIVNIPHASVHIPPNLPFFLSPGDLNREAHLAADLYTDCMLHPQREIIPVVAPVSRLVTDTERYEDDELEIAAASGHGVIYVRTITGKPLRPTPTNAERRELLRRYYYPHHKALSDETTRSLERFGSALILDLHSYPSSYAMPGMCLGERPDVCIGTVENHTPASLKVILSDCCRKFNLTYAFDSPFSGAILPRQDVDDIRVSSFMLEIRRDTYMEEHSLQRHAGWEKIQDFVNAVAAQLLRNRLPIPANYLAK